MTEKTIQVRLERTGTTGICPACKKKRRVVEDEYERGIRDLDVSGRKVTIYFKQYKIRCSCGYRGVERLEFVDKYSSCTIRFEEYVFMLCGLMSLKDVSKLAGIDWRAVKRIDKKYLAKKKVGLEHAHPKRLGVDEVSYAKRHKYLTVVRDVDARRVIWVGLDRRKEVLDGFFKELGTQKTREISLVVADMWDAYIASVKENCPNAEIVFDKFHVAKKANEALDKVRKCMFASASKEEKKEMKHKRFLILKRNEKLGKKQKETLNQLMKQNEQLYTAYLLKEQLASILDEPGQLRATRRLTWWFKNIEKSGISQYKKLAGTIHKYLYGILNYFKHKVTNAASEAFNNKIGLLKRKAYGYKDLEYFKLKIINYCWRSS